MIKLANVNRKNEIRVVCNLRELYADKNCEKKHVGRQNEWRRFCSAFRVNSCDSAGIRFSRARSASITPVFGRPMTSATKRPVERLTSSTYAINERTFSVLRSVFPALRKSCRKVSRVVCQSGVQVRMCECSVITWSLVFNRRNSVTAVTKVSRPKEEERGRKRAGERPT